MATKQPQRGVQYDPISITQLRGSIDDDGCEPMLIEEIDATLHDLAQKCMDIRFDGEKGASITVRLSVRRVANALSIDASLDARPPPKPRNGIVAVQDALTKDIVTQTHRQTSILDRIAENEEQK